MAKWRKWKDFVEPLILATRTELIAEVEPFLRLHPENGRASTLGYLHGLSIDAIKLMNVRALHLILCFIFSPSLQVSIIFPRIRHNPILSDIHLFPRAASPAMI